MGQISAILENLTLRQKFTIAGTALIVVLLIWQGIRWNRESDLRPLFTNLAAEDAGTLVERLRAANVRYKVGEQGTVLVPSALVPELRLEMAAAGLPRTGRIGFELFDKTNFGATDFAEQVNFRRALEGELERSITAIAEVERARVHVTFPKESVFLDHREPAKASVMVKLRPGASLQPQHLLGIAHLTASAVEGLTPEGVSIIDMAGALLSRPRRGLNGDAPGASSAMIEYRQALEREMLAKIHMTLDPLLGENKYRAGVSLECDFTSGEQSEEVFDPDSSVMVSSQKTEDVSGTSGPGAGGVPGTASSLPRPVARPAGGGSSVSRRTEAIAYQTSRVVKRTQIPQGAIKRLSVAVLVDQGIRWEGQGAGARRVLDAPPPEKLKVVKDLLAGVVGFQEQRGDQILVESLPFEATLTSAPPPAAEPRPAPQAPFPAPAWLKPLTEVAPLGVWIGAAGALVVVVLGGVLWMIRRRRRGRAGMTEAPRALPPEERDQQFEQKALAKIAEQEAERARMEEEALSALRLPPSTKKSEVLKKHIGEQARRDPYATAQLIRTWLSEAEK